MSSPQESRPRPDSPWRFLTPLSGEDAEDRRLLELTRAEELHLVNHMVASSRVSLLYSASGNGKTSLIQAGVLPFFQRQGYATFRTRPRPPWSQADPILAFRECLLRDLQGALLNARDERLLKAMERLAGEAPAAEREDLKALLKRLQIIARADPDAPQLDAGLRAELPGLAQAPLPELLARISDLLGRDRQILVVCDQFEELFVHYGRNRVIDRFVDELGKVWADTALPIHLLFSMREDWVGSMIAFRQQIPEIFRNYFRLAPIRRSVAAQVLTFPLAEEGKAFEPEAVQQILGDLTVCYARARGDESTASSPAVPGEDPFIELPALQIVAERLWETRQVQARPFSLAHYRSLADGARPEVSPAQQALDAYLEQMLAHLPGEMPDPKRDELRLDCLYLLTDRERHRRASTLARIARELRQIRPSELDLPQPADPEIRGALDPLVDARLVRRLDAGVEGEEYELAHDFEVRAVLASWRRLDRDRARELGRLSLQRKAKDRRLAELETGQKVMVDLLRGLPILGLAGLVWAVVLLWTGEIGAWEQVRPVPGPLWWVGGAFGLVTFLSLLTRHRRFNVLGVLGLVTALLIHSGIDQYERSLRVRYEKILEPVSSRVQGLRTTLRLQSTFSDDRLLGLFDQDLEVFQKKTQEYLAPPDLTGLLNYQKEVAGFFESYRNAFERSGIPPSGEIVLFLENLIEKQKEVQENLEALRRSAPGPEIRIRAYLAAGAAFLLLLLYLRALADLLGWRIAARLAPSAPGTAG